MEQNVKRIFFIDKSNSPYMELEDGTILKPCVWYGFPVWLNEQGVANLKEEKRRYSESLDPFIGIKKSIVRLRNVLRIFRP